MANLNFKEGQLREFLLEVLDDLRVDEITRFENGGFQEMDFKDIKQTIQEIADTNYEDFVKALISCEKGIEDQSFLDALYNEYMENDTQGLLNDEFDYAIYNLKEQGLLKEDKTKTDRDDLINIVGNLVNKPEILEIKDNKNETNSVVNFSIVSNGEDSTKQYHSCSDYGNRAKDVENFKQGDFVKNFG